MVETKTLYNAGLKSGAIEKDAVKVGVEEGYRLIAAPTATMQPTYALILWEPTDEKDRKPSHSKVVGIFSVALGDVTEGTTLGCSLHSRSGTP